MASRKIREKKREIRNLATIRKLANGKWQAQIARRGVRKSAQFVTKQGAKDWAARTEYTILNEAPKGESVTFGDAMERYYLEISPTKRGERWERLRLKKFCLYDIAAKRMRDLKPADFALWRDLRLREVSAGTVNREMALLSGVLSVARKEWGLIEVNPMADVRKPSKTPPRDRRVTDDELKALAISAGGDLTKATARAFHAFLFAIETAMRAGEIIGLRPQHIDVVKRVAHLPMTKNGTARDVPLSSEAIRLIEALPAADPVFDLDSAILDALWRKLRNRAAVTDLRFHDARHEAITRLARKLDVLDLARMVGHRDLRMLLIYYNATAEELAKRLD